VPSFLKPSLAQSDDVGAAVATVAGHSRFTSISSRTTTWAIAAAFALLAGRLAQFLDHYTVNLLYWDQWDFLQGLFDGADTWTLFRWQHGPQRQGLGNLIISIIYPASDWNGRVDAAASAVAMGVAALTALWLIKRIFGRLRAWDIVVPLLFLTTTNAETYVIAPNLAHGPLSALLLVAYALALTVTSHLLRCVTLVGLNFLAVNTGFTLLMGGITPLLLLLLACAPHVTPRDRAIYGVGIGASLGTLAFFLHGYVHNPATDCFQFPDARPWAYVPYVGFVLGRPFGLVAGETTAQLLVGSGIALALAGFVMYSTFRLVRAQGDSRLWIVTSTLASFALLFASSSAVGRLCLGFGSASATRYIPYVLPGILALYLVLRSASTSSPVASALLPVILVACVVKEADEVSANEAETYLRYKQRWKACYVSMHDIEACDAWAGHPVYPRPRATNLQQKLDWLEARDLNLFRDDARRSGTR
jgi:hypothetical protein